MSQDKLRTLETGKKEKYDMLANKLSAITDVR